MQYTAAAAAALALAAAASAAGDEHSKAVVQNNCDFPVHIWTTCSGAEAAYQGEYAPGGTFSEDFGEGACEVKVAQTDKALENGDPQSGLVYAANGDRVLYSLAHALGTSFAPLKADGDTDECEVIEWENGPGKDLQQSCSSERMIRLSLCGEESPDGEASPAAESGAAESSAAADGEEEPEPEEEEEPESEE